MVERNVQKVNRHSSAPLAGRIEQLKNLFPEAVNEDGFDLKTFSDLLGASRDRDEHYRFTWLGRQEAIRSLAQPSYFSLRPAPEESVNWETTKHLFIEGENLEVLKLLHESYFGRVKMIYIDPPYNTGNDYVYPDDYSQPRQQYWREIGQVDAEGNAQTSNLDRSGHRHASWLSMMYPRLTVARQLLREDGVIFVSIDDNEIHNLRLLMDRVFGEENFVSTLVWHSKYTQANDTKYISRQHEYIVIFAKNKSTLSALRVRRPESMNKRYSNPDNDPRGPWKASPLHAKSGSGGYEYTFENGYSWTAPPGTYPRYSRQTLRELEYDNRISFGKKGSSTPNAKTFLRELEDGVVSGSLWHYSEVGHTHSANDELAALLGKGVFDNPKSTKLIKQACDLCTTRDSGDLVLDFFAGSSTTAESVLALNREDAGNRRFIMVQLQEPMDHPDYANIAEVGKERIRRVIKRMNHQLGNDGDLGFRVFKLDESPIRQWEDLLPDLPAEEYERQLRLFVDNPLVENWTIEDVIADIVLKEAHFGLSYRVEHADAVTRQSVHKVIDDERAQHFYICLDDRISLENLRPLNLQKTDKFIFRDSAADDTTVANLALTCRIKSI